MSLSDNLKFIGNEIDKLLSEQLVISEELEAELIVAMRYASIGSGKKLRPYLVYASSNIFGVPLKQAIMVGAAVEMVHTYSLIHDDLPCMDNDDIRRGKPSLHKKFNESTAMLAGNSLLIKAFKILVGNEVHNDLGVRVRLISELAEVSGNEGMCGGQMIDLISESKNFDKEQIIRMNKMKTAAIISFSCMAGGILGGANIRECQVLKDFGFDIGLAFQIVDDILDVEGDENKIGKKINRDKDLRKKNLVSNYGLKFSKNEAQKLIDNANKSLQDNFGERSRELQEISKFIISRDR